MDRRFRKHLEQIWQIERRDRMNSGEQVQEVKLSRRKKKSGQRTGLGGLSRALRRKKIAWMRGTRAQEQRFENEPALTVNADYFKFDAFEAPTPIWKKVVLKLNNEPRLLSSAEKGSRLAKIDEIASEIKNEPIGTVEKPSVDADAEPSVDISLKSKKKSNLPGLKLDLESLFKKAYASKLLPTRKSRATSSAAVDRADDYVDDRTGDSAVDERPAGHSVPKTGMDVRAKVSLRMLPALDELPQAEVQLLPSLPPAFVKISKEPVQDKVDLSKEACTKEARTKSKIDPPKTESKERFESPSIETDVPEANMLEDVLKSEEHSPGHRRTIGVATKEIALDFFTSFTNVLRWTFAWATLVVLVTVLLLLVLPQQDEETAQLLRDFDLRSQVVLSDSLRAMTSQGIVHFQDGKKIDQVKSGQPFCSVVFKSFDQPVSPSESLLLSIKNVRHEYRSGGLNRVVIEPKGDAIRRIECSKKGYPFLTIKEMQQIFGTNVSVRPYSAGRS